MTPGGKKGCRSFCRDVDWNYWFGDNVCLVSTPSRGKAQDNGRGKTMVLKTSSRFMKAAGNSDLAISTCVWSWMPISHKLTASSWLSAISIHPCPWIKIALFCPLMYFSSILISYQCYACMGWNALIFLSPFLLQIKVDRVWSCSSVPNGSGDGCLWR